MPDHHFQSMFSQYETGAVLISGDTIKYHFDARRNPGRHGHEATLKHPPDNGMTRITASRQN